MTADSGYGLSVSKRKRDLFFACVFSFFAFSSFFSDRLHALDQIAHGDGMWSRANRWYAEVAGDDYLLGDHPYARLNTFISAFVWGPFYLVLVYAFATGANWIRPWALLYVGGMTHGVVEFMWWEYAPNLGPPPGNPLVFWAFNAPYVIVPILLGVRMFRPNPFGTRSG